MNTGSREAVLLLHGAWMHPVVMSYLSHALRGEGFHPLVKNGDSVRAGDPLLRFDIDNVARRARSLLTEMLITNMDVVSALRPRSGRVVGGRDVVLEVSLHEQRPARPSRRRQPITRSLRLHCFKRGPQPRYPPLLLLNLGFIVCCWF